jgi:putative transposase
LRQQIFLGDDVFVQAMLARAKAAARFGHRHPSKAARPGFDWPACLRTSASREQALYKAHTEAGQTMGSLAACLGLSVSRVSRLIAGHEQSLLGQNLA